MNINEQNIILLEAMKNIAYPITHMINESEKNNSKLNHYAFEISNDPNHLKSIAQKALADIGVV